MKAACIAGTLLCAAAMGDEIISTFGNDYDITEVWTVVGQTLTIPQANVLDGFTLAMQASTDDPVLFFIYVAPWDADAGTWGTAVWSDAGFIEGTSLQIFHFDDMGLHLPRDEDYIVLVSLNPALGVEAGVAFVDDDYDAGALVTNIAFADPEIWPEYDMLFSAEFVSCGADFNGDGNLNIFDFLAFQYALKLGKMEADCNGDGILNVLDFVCFQDHFLAGC